ncbi:MAG: metallophosphoesterase [Halobacteriovoraceae bacterium]|nr:metallophosphoesterase [Halobacteriovoraceae bacterium]
MRLTFFSDTHSKHHEIPHFTGGDILFHCGDITKKGDLKELENFAEFISVQDYTHKIVIAVNHDFCFEAERSLKAEMILKDQGIVYLNDSGIVIDELKIWGSPIQPKFFNWAFNRKRGNEIKKHWDLIPDDTNILITHGPPFGILDLCATGIRVGCEDLLIKVKELSNLKIHAFGHVHEDYGIKTINDVSFVNACSLNEKCRYSNEPIYIEA